MRSSPYASRSRREKRALMTSSYSSPLRLLQVTPHYFPSTGGTQTHVHEVGRQLARMGAQVTILTTDISSRLPETEESEGMHIRRVHPWSLSKERDYFRFAPDIFRVISQGRWDVVHCQGLHTLAPPIAMLAALKAKIPYVVSFHSGGNSSPLRMGLQKVEWHALRPLLERAERLICPSGWEVEYFRAGFHLPERLFEIIPNGANHLADYIPEPMNAEMTSHAGDSKLIVSVGRLELYKGHQRVIAALPRILEQIPDTRLRIIGSGPYESTLQNLAQTLGVADRVEIRAVPPGDNGGMASVMSRADVVTLLSEHEAQGIAALEALALKRPVLVAYTSALRELADRGIVRAVPLNSSPEVVAAAIVDQIRHPLPQAPIELPTWEKCASDLMSVYRTVARASTQSKQIAVSPAH
jgi:glycosyltransferase involved in cell wall biosynthesis